MTAAGVAATASGAFAQAAPADATVNFQGLVGSVCTFSNVVAGTLGNSGSPLMTSDPADGGMDGSVDVSCTGSAELSVSTPQDNGSTNDLLATALNYEAVAEIGAGTPGSNMTVNSSQFGPSGPAFMPGPVDETVRVGMMIDAGTPVPEGAYNYNVVVTATPL